MALILPLLLAMAGLLLLSAAFSASEAAFLALNKVRLRHLMQRGSLAAKLVYEMLTQLDLLITTILVGNNFINVGMTVIGTLLCVKVFGEQYGSLIAAFGITALILVFAEITPKIFAAAHADRVALVLVWPMRALVRVFRPMTWAFTKLSHAIIYVLGGHLPRSALVTEEEVKVMIEMGREAGAVTENELRMLHRIFEFEDAVVRDVMIPREQIVGVEINQKPETVLDAMVEGHSRVPVYRGTLDQIEGVVYAHDLLAVWRHGGLFVLADLVRPAHFIRDHKRVGELLRDFQRLKIQMAIVQNVRGDTVGLVTLEDLLEEIVGELDEQAPTKHRRR